MMNSEVQITAYELLDVQGTLCIILCSCKVCMLNIRAFFSPIECHKSVFFFILGFSKQNTALKWEIEKRDKPEGFANVFEM